MNNTFIRIDNRLVHGQILEGWVPFIKASRIVVVNDEVASDLFQETVIKMAVPHDIEVLVFGVDEFATDFAQKYNDKKETIVLFKDIDDSLRAFKTGFCFDRLNIGNVHRDNGSLCCSTSILLNNRDIENVKYLMNSGVKVEVRCVPRDKPLDFFDIVKKLK